MPLLLVPRSSAAAPAASSVLADEIHQNYGSVVGTPTLVTGALTRDTDKAMQFDGSTNSASVPSSTSDSLAVGASGGAAVELFVKFSALPGSTKDIVSKPGSYALQVTSAGKLLWTLVNGSNTVTVTSNASLTTGVFHHVVGVYNGDFTGTPQVGVTTQGSLRFSIPADQRQGVATGAQNIQVSKGTILEKGHIDHVNLGLIRTSDATSPEWLAAVLYADNAGSPGALLAQSMPQLISPTETFAFVAFDAQAVLYPGAFWQGVIAGSGFAEFGPISLAYETSGGVGRKSGSHGVSDSGSTDWTGSAPDPFSTVGSTDVDDKLSIYSDYTPLARTGDEGHALLYINGQLDNSASYTGGIALSASPIAIAPSLAVTIDELSIWNKKLTNVQVATHYAAR
jgi:hypothetical protein